jgi:hypothetical protein
VINLVIIYQWDKYLFLRFYQAPPHLGPELPKLMTRIILWAAILHILNGLWMFGNRMFYDPNIKTTFNMYEMIVDGLITQFPEVTHEWIRPISWTYRLTSKNSAFLLTILFILLIFLAFDQVIDNLLEAFSLYYLIAYLAKLLGYDIDLEDFVPEDNPPYFDSIPLPVLKQRVATGKWC